MRSVKTRTIYHWGNFITKSKYQEYIMLTVPSVYIKGRSSVRFWIGGNHTVVFTDIFFWFECVYNTFSKLDDANECHATWAIIQIKDSYTYWWHLRITRGSTFSFNICSVCESMVVSNRCYFAFHEIRTYIRKCVSHVLKHDLWTSASVVL